VNLARGIRLLHREYGFGASEVLKMSVEDYAFWIESLSEDKADSGGALANGKEFWVNIE
jgi:hypothetical protein